MEQYRIPQFLEKSFNDGFSYSDDTGNKYEFYSYSIGNLRVNNGRIIACDPFLYNHNPPFEKKFPIGNFPVQLAVAKINDDERVGFARIKFSDQEPVAWTMAASEGQDLSTLQQDEIFGYGVDAGTGAFMDAPAGDELFKFLTEKDNNFQVLIVEMEKNYKHTWDWLLWERRDLNVAMFKSGWGDGFYASYIGGDIQGNICRLVTDFSIID
jgi:hypothetical protein